ncbi:MAG: hypothetical protein QN162_14445 [Armatimonadota bacterium]|nr:hypothetical protein [Armatimonadota bacterium]
MTEIKGWGLWEPDQVDAEWFAYEYIGEPQGCKNSRCAHVSHAQAAPEAAWIPRPGVRIFWLGYGPLDRADLTEKYFAAARGDEVRFYRYVKPLHYWTRIEPVDPGDVPAYIRARLTAEL